MAPNYDILADSPLLLGRFTRYQFPVRNVSHELAVAGEGGGTLPCPEFLGDLSAIIETAANVFGGLPYTHYHFLVSLTENGGGGLEHLNSANIMVTPQRWRAAGQYSKLLGLFAHEYFHAWNVKRLHPQVLGPFDYQHEVYTSLLWVLEGFTDYFAAWILAKSQVVPVSGVLADWADRLHQLDQIAGRLVTSLADASREAWIRQYRPDANTANITVSYYLKGGLAALFLDLELQHHSQGEHSLAEVMRILWDRHGDGGYPEESFEELLVEMGGAPMQELLSRYVHGTDPFDESILETVGLRLERQFREPEGERPVWLGVSAVERQGRLYARSVERESPAERVGVSPDDELIAINGRRVSSAEQWNAGLARLDAGHTAVLHISHQGGLEELAAIPEPPRADQYQLVPVKNPTPQQQARFQQWLGAPWPNESR